MLRTLQTRCSIIASANPKGFYDNEDPLSINTALSSPLLSRFDLILLTLDTQNQEWDNIAASFITEGIDVLGSMRNNCFEKYHVEPRFCS